MTQRATSPRHGRTPQRAALKAYPFSAIVGQGEMKLALLLNVIDASIGGVLIMGHRGTGKSTAVRAIADLLPQIWKVTNCHYGCDPGEADELCDDCYGRLDVDGKLPRSRSEVPVVTLPLGATEDRVCGTIDIQRALTEGVKAFEPGLLARANRGFLYVDEVNLLEDHLVDLLLDVAVTGRNTVERESISLEHPARFVLVGSGNPEEGELRPQLVDRFGLCAEVKTLEDLNDRVEIVRLREAFDRDADTFRASVEADQQSLRRRLARSRKLVEHVSISKDLMRNIAGICLHLRIDGHRGELTITRAARALAAYEGLRKVTEDHIRRVAALSLRHRLRRDPLEPTAGGGARVEQALENAFFQTDTGVSKDKPRSLKTSDKNLSSGEWTGGAGKKSDSDDGCTNRDSVRLAPEQVDQHLQEPLLGDHRGQSTNKRSSIGLALKHHRGGGSSYNLRRGRYSRAFVHGTSDSRIAIDATLRATAIDLGRHRSDQNSTRGHSPTRFTRHPTPYSLRFKAFKRKHGSLFIMAIDTSGSMAANRIAHAKGALVSLLNKSYIRRDRVALVSFRGDKAEELLQPSQSMSRARRALDELLMGGTTPLASAIVSSLNIAIRAARQGTEHIILLIMTDGRANVALRDGATTGLASKDSSVILDELDQLRAGLLHAGVSTIIVDTQNRFTSSGEGRALAERLGARYMILPLTKTGY